MKLNIELDRVEWTAVYCILKEYRRGNRLRPHEPFMDEALDVIHKIDKAKEELDEE